MRLRGKLALATAATAAAAVVVVAGLGAVLAATFLERAAVSDLRRQTRLAAEVLRVVEGRDQDGQSADRNQRVLARVLGITDVEVSVHPVGGLTGTAARLVSPEDQARARAGTVDGRAELDGVTYVYVAAPADRHVVVLHRPLAGLGDAARAVRQRLLLAGLVGAGIAGIAGLWLGGRLSRPVGALSDVADAIAGGELDRMPPAEVADREDEIGDLARAVGSMAARLDRARDDQRRFLLSIGHELRTPLTNIVGYAEALEEGKFDGERRTAAARVVHDEATRLSRLVGDLMTLARLDAGEFEITPSHGDVAVVVRGAVEAWRETAEEAGVEIAADTAPAVLETDPDRVRQIVDNLVANALRVTPASGSVRVACRPSVDGGVEIAVSDTGPGILADDVPLAFERYGLWRRYRGLREVGTGLGLSIVAELAEALGGGVGVDPGGDGRGATFTVRLPARPPAFPLLDT